MLDTAITILKKITSHGYKAYIVGGYPRDLYMGLTSLDIDICTNATPKNLKEIFTAGSISKEEYGSVTLIYNKTRFEITTFRKEIKYENNRFPVAIKYIDTLTDDLERRDFTINTLCINENGDYIDLLNAKEDIDKKIIKTISDPFESIKTDILRSLRAIRFATVLNFQIDANLKESIKKNASLLKQLSYFRKKEELSKIFSSTNASYGISLLKELNLAEALELHNLDNVVITTSPIGIWAQLGLRDLYGFTNNEKKMIDDIQTLLNKDILDNNNLYHYGLYLCTLVGEIKNIPRKEITIKYNALQIYSQIDIKIKPLEICELLNKQPGSFIKEIIVDLENKLINNLLTNNKEEIINYIRSNYEFKKNA